MLALMLVRVCLTLGTRGLKRGCSSYGSILTLRSPSSFSCFLPWARKSAEATVTCSIHDSAALRCSRYFWYSEISLR